MEFWNRFEQPKKGKKKEKKKETRHRGIQKTNNNINAKLKLKDASDYFKYIIQKTEVGRKHKEKKWPKR